MPVVVFGLPFRYTLPLSGEIISHVDQRFDTLIGSRYIAGQTNLVLHAGMEPVGHKRGSSQFLHERCYCRQTLLLRARKPSRFAGSLYSYEDIAQGSGSAARSGRLFAGETLWKASA